MPGKVPLEFQLDKGKMKKKNLKSVRKSISRSLSVSKSPWLAVMMLRSHVIKPSPRPGGRLHTACVWQASEMETFKSCERIYFLSYYFLRSIERPYLPVPASGKIFNKCIVSIFCHTFVSGGKKKTASFYSQESCGHTFLQLKYNWFANVGKAQINCLVPSFIIQWLCS